MTNLQRAYRYLLAKPFRWIFIEFFQGSSSVKEYIGWGFRQRIVSTLPLIVSIFLLVYPISLAGRAILIPFHLMSYSNVTSFLLETVFGIIRGIVLCILVCIVFDVEGTIVLGLAFSIAFGIAFGITTGIVVAMVVAIVVAMVVAIGYISTAGSIADNVLVSIIISIVFGIAASGIEPGLVAGVGLGIVIGGLGEVSNGSTRIKDIISLGIVFGIISGITGSIAGSIGFGITGGITSIIVFVITVVILGCIGSIIGAFRLPIYLISGPSVLKAYFFSQANPQQALTYLQRSSLHWDERVYLPLPYLKRTLLLAYEKEPEQTLQEIVFIATKRPRQLRAAREAIVEIVMRDLEARKTLAQIAEVPQRLSELMPLGTKLMDPLWEAPFARLTDGCKDAERYITPISRRAKAETLEDMMRSLQRVYPNVAFRNQQLNRRLSQVVEAWLAIVQDEQQQLACMQEGAGQIDNPYKPAIVLENFNDTLFVGRHDIAEQLEVALRKRDGRPTFLMNGERRMGKSSTLLHLPRLLGSRYISIFYNLQSPGIYANSFIFLEWIADHIQKEIQERGLKVKRLSLASQARQATAIDESSASPSLFTSNPFAIKGGVNNALAYSLLNNWLVEVEQLLEQEGRVLLLAFDEFEKLEQAGEKGSLDLVLLLDWFREIIQFHPRLVLLFSGVHTIDEMGKGAGNAASVNWASYFVNVRTLHMGFLQQEEALQLITHPVENYPADDIYGIDVVEKIIIETGCHPFLIQAVCSALIDNLNTERRAMAAIRDVEQAIEKVLEEWNGYFYELWTRTDNNQRVCLTVIQMAGMVDMRLLLRSTHLDEWELRGTLQTLQRRDLIKQNDGTFRIASPIFSKWVERNSHLQNMLSIDEPPIASPS